MSSAVDTCYSQIHRTRDTAYRRPAHEPKLRVCTDCLRLTAQRLAEVSLLYRQLEQELVLRSRPLPFLSPTRSRQNSSTIINEAIIDTRMMIKDLVVSWSNLISDERRVSLPQYSPQDSVETLSIFLLHNLRWLCAHPAAADFVREIDNAFSSAAGEFGLDGNVDLRGYTCLAEDCGDPLRAILRSYESRLRIELLCGRGHSWPPDRWLKLKNGSPHDPPNGEAGTSTRRGPRLVSTKAAALALGVPETTIRQWAHRGKLTRYGTVGRAEYDLQELIEVFPSAQRGGGDP